MGDTPAAILQSITCQYPPLSGPILFKKPNSLRRFILCFTLPNVTLSIFLIISCVVAYVCSHRYFNISSCLIDISGCFYMFSGCFLDVSLVVSCPVRVVVGVVFLMFSSCPTTLAGY